MEWISTVINLNIYNLTRLTKEKLRNDCCFYVESLIINLPPSIVPVFSVTCHTCLYSIFVKNLYYFRDDFCDFLKQFHYLAAVSTQ